jgi:hypothetical protein
MNTPRIPGYNLDTDGWYKLLLEIRHVLSKGDTSLSFKNNLTAKRQSPVFSHPASGCHTDVRMSQIKSLRKKATIR